MELVLNKVGAAIKAYLRKICIKMETIHRQKTNLILIELTIQVIQDISIIWHVNGRQQHKIKHSRKPY